MESTVQVLADLGTFFLSEFGVGSQLTIPGEEHGDKAYVHLAFNWGMLKIHIQEANLIIEYDQHSFSNKVKIDSTFSIALADPNYKTKLQEAIVKLFKETVKTTIFRTLSSISCFSIEQEGDKIIIGDQSGSKLKLKLHLVLDELFPNNTSCDIIVGKGEPYEFT